MCIRTKLVRLPGVAPGHSPWRGDILLLNYNREIKRAGSNHAPGPCHFNKEQTPLAILRYQPTVSRWFFRCLPIDPARSAESKGVWGTPPAKPLDCKIRLNSLGALGCDRWAEPTGGEPRLSHAFFGFVPGDILKTSVSFHSQCYAFRCRVCCFFSILHGQTKNPASIPVSRV